MPQLAEMRRLMMAVKLDMHRSAVGASSRQARRFTPEDIEWIEDNHSTWTVRDAAAHLGVARGSLRKYASRKGIKFKPSRNTA